MMLVDQLAAYMSGPQSRVPSTDAEALVQSSGIFALFC